MYPALGFRVGNPLNTVHAAFKLHLAVDLITRHLEGYLFVPPKLRHVGIHDVDLPALPLRVTGIHAE